MEREAYLSVPFRLTPEGSLAAVDASEHTRQRMEQILFTSPGERVMLPEFGSGVRNLIFAANNETLAAAAEFTIARALQTHMGSQVMINGVDVVSEGEAVRINVVYTRTRDLREERLTLRVLPFDRRERA